MASIAVSVPPPESTSADRTPDQLASTTAHLGFLARMVGLVGSDPDCFLLTGKPEVIPHTGVAES
jgi:hypothetical protein